MKVLFSIPLCVPNMTTRSVSATEAGILCQQICVWEFSPCKQEICHSLTTTKRAVQLKHKHSMKRKHKSICLIYATFPILHKICDIFFKCGDYTFCAAKRGRENHKMKVHLLDRGQASLHQFPRDLGAVKDKRNGQATD